MRYSNLKSIIKLKNIWKNASNKVSFEEEYNKRVVRDYTRAIMAHPIKTRYEILNKINSNIEINSKSELKKLEEKVNNYKQHVND